MLTTIKYPGEYAKKYEETLLFIEVMRLFTFPIHYNKSGNKNNVF